MHRNTYIVVSILAVLAALIVGVNLGKKISPSTTPTPTPTGTAAQIIPTPTLTTYVDSACGFSIKYSDGFTLLDSASGSAVLNFANDQTKSIVMTCQKDIPRPPLPADRIESISIPATAGASASAKLYHDQTAKDGKPIDAVIFTHPSNKLDVFISGYGEAFNSLIKTIQILP